MTLNRHKPLIRSPFNPKKGRKVRWWERTRADLKKEFAARGIVTCELRLPGCLVDDQLSFMHRVKRRFVTTDEEMRTVILSCVPCHTVYELGGHERMREAVDAAIAGRATKDDTL
jgi:hypothetical protein